MLEHLGADRFRWADHLALYRKAADKRRMEAFEEVDVLRFFASEIEDRSHPPVVTQKVRTRMVDHERKNELFDDAEDTKVLMCTDLVEQALLDRVQTLDRCRAGEALGHHVTREVEFLVLAQDVVELPLGAER